LFSAPCGPHSVEIFHSLRDEEEYWNVMRSVRDEYQDKYHKEVLNQDACDVTHKYVFWHLKVPPVISTSP
jgi:hypothetical protein